MNRVLLGFAASAAAIFSATPAPAQQFTAGFSSGADSRFMTSPSGDFQGGNHHRRHHGNGDFVPWGWDSGQWALYNNRSFQPDSYNDWWHDRPDRAFPRWMQSNQDCARMWWGGGGWRC